ncbi:MAG: hypothetical protein AAB482_03005 [Patescibacteria group bacterium]
MRILVASWPSKWAERIKELIKVHFPHAEVVLVHSKNCQKPMTLYTKCIMRETGEQKIYREEIQYGSMTCSVMEKARDERKFDLFDLSTDFGFRPVAECIRAIRLWPKYRFTPTIIHSAGDPIELARAEKLGVTHVVSGYDISPIVSILNSLERESEVRL